MDKVLSILLSFLTVALCARNTFMNDIHLRDSKDPRTQRNEKFMRICAKELKTSVDFDDLRGHLYHAGTYKDKKGKIVEPSKDIKRNIKCILQKYGVLDQHDNYNPESIKRIPHDVREFTKACISKISATGCQKAYEIMKCINKSSFEWMKKHGYKNN